MNAGPRLLIVSGLALVIIGAVWSLAGDRLHWLGRLPGDIRVQRPGFSFYFPITTMLLMSVLLTLMVNLVRKLL